jgi:alpha-ribazole phosphatase
VLRPELAFSVDARLREMDFGSWEGVAWSEIPRAAVDSWTQDLSTHRFGGKESANEVIQRVAAAWDEAQFMQTRAQGSGQGSKHVLWIAHSGVAQAATLLASGVREVREAGEWPTLSLKYGEWLTF